MKYWYTAAIAAISLLAFAAPAHADDGLYLQVLEEQMAYNYDRYGSDLLLDEGYKVCDAVSEGYDFESILSMIQSDLDVSSFAAGSIYGAATAGLGC